MGNWKIGRPPYLCHCLSTAFGSLCPLMADANVQQTTTPSNQRHSSHAETKKKKHWKEKQCHNYMGSNVA